MADKTNIGVQVDKGIWFKFRGQAFNEGVTASELLERVMQDYIIESQKKLSKRRRNIKL